MAKRGFGGMSLEKRREIARMGGKAAQASGRAHNYSSEEAREAGRKGGKKLSEDREHMSEIGRRGGLARSRKAKEKAEKAAEEEIALTNETDGTQRRLFPRARRRGVDL